MSDIVIKAERLCKSYRLYESPRHRVLDVLGIGRRKGGARQHQALIDFSVTIRRGEKVGIIGRNGAGKSTLLKLVSQVIAPTSGTLQVSGKTRALLSIGTGFHPEFTGRQNVTAYLANLGIQGRRLDDLVEQAIDFAEIEDYVDQPLKAYSTGMSMRIMFAAATMIRPELLIIDEVLGVGDAYFQHKSFQHIKELCAAGGTTLLLVTHDVYSASALCDRLLWLDRGHLLIDGSPKVVMGAYQDAVREQEERRLRAKALAARGRGAGKSAQQRILVDIRSDGNRPPQTDLFIASVSLLVGGVQVATAPMTDLAFGGDGTSYLVAEGSNWGDAQWIRGRLARPLKSYGSPFHKVTAAFHLQLDDVDLRQIGVRVIAYSETAGPFSVCLHGDGLERVLGPLILAPGQWSDCVLTGEEPQRPRLGETSQSLGVREEPGPSNGTGSKAGRPVVMSPSLNTEGRHGSGDVEIVSLRVFDEAGLQRHIFPAGRPMEFRLDFRLRRPNLREQLTIVLVFKRDGVTDVARLLSDDLHFDAEQEPNVSLSIRWDACPLGAGRYTVTTMIAAGGYHRQRQTVFFAINPAVYDVQSDLLDIEIEDTSSIHSGTGALLTAVWSRVSEG